MLILRTPEESSGVIDLSLRSLVQHRFAALSEDGVYDADALGALVVVEGPADLNAVSNHLGFSVLENRIDGRRFGEPGFRPSFELIEEHACCYELVFVLSDDGFGALVFIPKSIDFPADLLAMCRKYAIRSQELLP
ncbi:hypothetical protein [Ramlibacter albus]|uniref:Uncharacterized protein n=1 Tax=Ramlibacter albus TaxID=2079448 RepID=A0A923MEL9_9BURK|nr:hypothetical protein [Ramlibacter albus]MBC5768691.1 hypothetical protein [Ramlibacter albus]